MANSTLVADLPPLPAYTVKPLPDLLPFISDFWLSLILPHIAYWVVSLIFHVIDIYDLFPQYRLHTPVEISQRNLASRYEVARDVVLEQILQVGMSATLSLTESRQMTGMEDYDVAVWATRIRLAQRSLPTLLGLLGLNALSISKNMAASHPLIAGALAGGHYPFLTTPLDGDTGTHVPAFATWELVLAKLIYWGVIPGMQLLFGIIFLDTWQYFWHRAMHVNKWMYSKLQFRDTDLKRVADTVTSKMARKAPPPLRPLRLRRSLQPPGRRLRSRHCRRRSRLQGLVHDPEDGAVVLRRKHDEDRGRPLWLRVAMGPPAAPYEQQRRISRHSPPELGYQAQLLAAILHFLGQVPQHQVHRRDEAQVRTQ